MVAIPKLMNKYYRGYKIATILKCKMCGGNIEVSQDMAVGTCLYCGSTMTLPKVDSDKKARLFNRANQYRLNCEFDKAYEAYKTIIEEDEQEAEAYWGMILSEYGVEYVEESASKKRVPTCHRTSIKSIQSTTNYDLACKYADAERKFMYQDEAEELDRIQKAILAISSKEEPYDVFICYKETVNDTGERTIDSVIAQDIYNELVKNNVKVFFSRITLEDKLGQDYEPYIYSALMSSKIMLVVGTSNENINSAWVKNEWSRYLHFMKDDLNKKIIPIYKDLAIYELPDELNKFQAQDYGKIGALQDLVHSVQKLISVEAREKKNIAIEELIQEKIEREQKKNERIVKGKKTANILKKVGIIVAILGIIVFAGIKGYTYYQEVLYPEKLYNQALELVDEDYELALEKLIELNQNPNIKSQIDAEEYGVIISNLNSKRYMKAIDAIKNVKGYKESSKLIMKCIYREAYNNVNSDYIDLKEKLKKLEQSDDIERYYYKCYTLLKLNKTTPILTGGSALEVYTEDELYVLGVHAYRLKDYKKAIQILRKCPDYEDSIKYLEESYEKQQK